MKIQEEMNIRQWAQDMAGQKASGLKQKEWCKVHGINLNTYQYRCKRVRRVMRDSMHERDASNEMIPMCADTPEPVFAKVNLVAPQAQASGIRIQTDAALISVAPDVQPEQIRVVLEAVLHAE